MRVKYTTELYYGIVWGPQIVGHRQGTIGLMLLVWHNPYESFLTSYKRTLSVKGEVHCEVVEFRTNQRELRSFK